MSYNADDPQSLAHLGSLILELDARATRAPWIKRGQFNLAGERNVNGELRMTSAVSTAQVGGLLANASEENEANADLIHVLRNNAAVIAQALRSGVRPLSAKEMADAKRDELVMELAGMIRRLVSRLGQEESADEETIALGRDAMALLRRHKLILASANPVPSQGRQNLAIEGGTKVPAVADVPNASAERCLVRVRTALSVAHGDEKWSSARATLAHDIRMRAGPRRDRLDRAAKLLGTGTFPNAWRERVNDLIEEVEGHLEGREKTRGRPGRPPKEAPALLAASGD